jgi:hypothetical protein
MLNGALGSVAQVRDPEELAEVIERGYVYDLPSPGSDRAPDQEAEGVT